MDNLNRKVDTYCSENRISGMLRVTVKDQILWEQNVGFADQESRTPFCKDSAFNLYSLSKPFLAIGLMRLKDGGRIDIDSHPARYVPEAAGFCRDVTIRQMLHHTSGLPDFMQSANFHEIPGKTDYPADLREQLPDLATYPQHFTPGTNCMYANINMTLCALAIENITGMDYADYMRETVFRPLGMQSAQIDKPGLEVPHRVTGYELSGDMITPADRCLHWMHGAGDMIATVEDVYCLNRAIKHRLLLTEESWREILTPSPVCSFGMGCRVNHWHGKKRIIHNGGFIGFRTLHIQLPEDDFDLIILSNSGWGSAREDPSEIIYEAFYGQDGSARTHIELDKGYI
jgi:CubicO group peptidase (beta-lactamase class C family)